MSNKRIIRPQKNYGKRVDYSVVLKRRKIRREVILWIVEIIAVVALAAVIAYFILN